MKFSKLIPLGKLKRLLFIALLVVFACEEKEESESFNYTLLRTYKTMCLIYSQPIDYGWEWIIDIGIENNTNYYIDSISVGYIVSFTDTTTISKSDTLNIMIYSFGHSSVIPPKTNIVYTTWNHSDCKYPPEDYQENASEYIESIEITSTNIFQFEPHYYQFE